LARPLLEVSRAETEAYCAARGWQPRIDPTNADTTFLRNRIRHKLLPILEAYNPRIRRTLAANAVLLTEDERYLEAQADAAWAACILQERADRVTFARPALLAQPSPLRRRVLRRAVARLTGGEHGLEAVHSFALDKLLARGGSGARLDLP